MQSVTAYRAFSWEPWTWWVDVVDFALCSLPIQRIQLFKKKLPSRFRDWSNWRKFAPLGRLVVVDYMLAAKWEIRNFRVILACCCFSRLPSLWSPIWSLDCLFFYEIVLALHSFYLKNTFTVLLNHVRQLLGPQAFIADLAKAYILHVRHLDWAAQYSYSATAGAACIIVPERSIFSFQVFSLTFIGSNSN